MDCYGACELLSDYRDGSLPAPVMQEVTRHLLECAGCSEVDRSLQAVRKGLRGLPAVSAPPELLVRINESTAREGAARSAPSRAAASVPSFRNALSFLKVPLEAAAVVLLSASLYWYWTGSRSAPVPGTFPAPVEVASSASPPASAPPSAPAAAAASPGAPVRSARKSPAPAVSTPPRAGAAELPDRSEVSIASLPEDTPDPKVRVWSLSDLPAAPVLRASTNFRRIVPASPQDAPATELEHESRSAGQAASASHPRLRPPVPYGREVSLEVAQEDRDAAGERIGEAALRLGGSVEGTDRVMPGGTVAVRVLLPERTAAVFFDELGRIGNIPPDGMPARSVLPAGPVPGTIAYTVRLRSR